MKSKNYLLIGVLSLAAAVALVAFAATNAMASATSENIKPLPIIIDRKCGQADQQGVVTCTLTYQSGVTQQVKVKDGKIVSDEAN